MTPILLLEDPDSLVVWPLHEVALLMDQPSRPGRLQAVHRDGHVAHRPGPLQAGPPLQPHQGVLLNPHHAVEADAVLHLPGGWTFPGPAPAAAPAAQPDPTAPLARQDGEWVLSEGAPPPATPPDDLVPAGRGLHLNRARLRRLRTVRNGYLEVVMDTGHGFRLTPAAARQLAGALGVPHLRHLEPEEPARDLALRDWPAPLLHAPAAQGLTLRQLIANVLWQAAFRQGGNPGRDHRGFWYRPLLPILLRAGFPDDEATWQTYLAVLREMVGDRRMLTFRRLGFEDSRPELRRVGDRRAADLVVAEKTSLRHELLALHTEFGASTLQIGGFPPLLASEFLVEDLLARGITEITVYAYVDWDVQGREVAESLVAHLRRYGMGVADLRFLVRPERFTAQEIADFAFPVSGQASRIAAWLRETGGIGGRALGMHADHLRPLERILRAYREEARL